MALSKTNNKLALSGKLDVYPNVDRTLSVDGWCAEAKTTGERFKQVEKEIADAYEAMSSISGVDPSIITHTTSKNNPHEVTSEQIGAAPAVHEHSADDVTSGTIPPERGGTGANTLADAIVALLAAGYLVLDSKHMGDELPNAGMENRLFLKKVK